jgi:hypothetical protein
MRRRASPYNIPEVEVLIELNTLKILLIPILLLDQHILKPLRLYRNANVCFESVFQQ